MANPPATTASPPAMNVPETVWTNVAIRQFTTILSFHLYRVRHLASVRCLHLRGPVLTLPVETDDPELDEELAGWTESDRPVRG